MAPPLPSRVTRRAYLKNAIRFSIVIGCAASLPLAFAQTPTRTDQIVEEVMVTGSRISRATNLDTTVPLQVLTAENIIELGRFSVADALRSTTANTFGSLVPSSGSTAQSQATVDLLGVGENRTLVLLDGRRLPGSPSLGGTAVNINQIPLAMVESIDILKGGGSAVYGSDAVAGVVNVRLKDSFEGFEVSFNSHNPTDKGGDALDYSIVTGISSDRGNITIAYEHHEQKPVFDRDRPYTAPSFADTDGDGAYDDLTGISVYGASILNPDTDLFEASPLCDTLAGSVPGYVGVVEEFPEDENRYCGYAYSEVSANQASTNRDSIFVKMTYDINENVEVFARMLFTHNKSFGRYAPPAALWPNNVPANSAHNPYDEAVTGLFRWHQIGNRDGTVNDYSQDYVIGINGSFSDRFEYEVYYHHNTTDNKSVGEYYLSAAGVAYNLFNEIEFDDPEGVNNLRATTLTEDFNRVDQLFAGLSFEAGELGGSAISHYIGAEGFTIEYSSTVDAQSAAGLIGGSAGNSSGRERDIWAAFYEALIPLGSKLELELAVRYDDYSDFGNQTSPKIAATYRPTDSVMLRASYNKGFRAPTLDELSQATGESFDSAADYVVCQASDISVVDCPTRQFRTFRQANPDLVAETSTYLNLGIVYERSNFNITLDYFDLEIEDAIRFVRIQDLIFMELVGVESPDPLLSIDRESVNFNQPEFTTATINGPGLEVNGLNLSAFYGLETEFGVFDFDLETLYFLDWSQDNYAGGPIQNKAGWSLQPEYRLQLTNSWRQGPHSLVWNLDYIPSTSSNESPDPNDIGSGLLIKTGKNKDFLIQNLTYTFDADRWGQYRIGVRNLTDEDPVLDSTGTYAPGYEYLYSAGHVGRIYSIGATWEL